jgi:beta-glucosidase
MTQPSEETKALVGRLEERELLHLVSGDGPLLRGSIAMSVRYNPTPYEAGRLDARGIEGVRFTDGPRGIVMGHCTAFPVPMARGATFDPELEARVGDAIGVEGRTLGANLFAGVCINLLRHPAWGRAQETYGEDTHHLGEMGAALVRGTQRHLMACVKHYACNSMENSRFWVDVVVDEADLRDIYLPHFKRCIDEGASAVMSAYNKVNGKWCGQNRFLLTDTLKDAWGFDGFVMSDFSYGVRGSAVACFNNGLDLEMPLRWRFRKLGRALARGRVTRTRLEDAATRLLHQQERQKGRGEAHRYRRDAIASPVHRELAYRVAVEGSVLLENHDTLPLDPAAVRTVAVLGRLATMEATGDLGSSQVRPPEVVTLLDGVRRLAETAGTTVTYDDGRTAARAGTLAAGADAVIVAVGNSHRDEGEWIGRTGGDRRQVTLSPEAQRLIAAACAANPRTTVVLFGGSAFVTEPWRHGVGALLAAWYPGMEGGRALADVLFGNEVPGGRLPCSWPADASQLPPFKRWTRRITYGPLHGYRMHEANGTRPSYPFGFGLGYTTIEWGDPEVGPADADGRVCVRVTLTNTGTRPGVEVVQGYVARALGSEPRRLRTLSSFQKVALAPGASTVVSLEVPWAPGDGNVWIGPSSDPDHHRAVPLPD